VQSAKFFVSEKSVRRKSSRRKRPFSTFKANGQRYLQGQGYDEWLQGFNATFHFVIVVFFSSLNQV